MKMKYGRPTSIDHSAIIHIPHSSLDIPGDVRSQFCMDEAGLVRELELMTDRYTDELFAGLAPIEQYVVFPVSRLVVDPERFEDDSLESMSRKGMGVVYMRTSHGEELRRPVLLEETERLLARFYRPHHGKLSGLTEREIGRNGFCLIIDGHSFPSRPLPYEYDQSQDRPDICIGTDEFHTPATLSQMALELLGKEFDKVELNRPFSGSIVPSAYYGRDKRVLSIMIEINRALYMDESSGERLPTFNNVAERVGKALRTLISNAALLTDQLL